MTRFMPSMASPVSVIAFLLGCTTAGADDAPQRTVSVSGRGTSVVATYLADINVGVMTRATTAQAALASNSERMSTLKGILKERDVADADVQTSQFSVVPVYSQAQPYAPGQPQQDVPPKIATYQVQNMVRITVRDLAKLGALLDVLVGAGANQIYGVNLRSDDKVSLDEARKKAMADARKKAELLAGEAGMVLGAAVSIREDAPAQYGYGSVPPPTGPYAMAPPAIPMMSVPISPGEQEREAKVFVVYELKRSELAP
jgi:uncharacterized protein YggE